MPEYEIFPNAPVEEAIITIRLAQPSDLDSLGKSFCSALHASYPVVEAIDWSSDEPPQGVTTAPSASRGLRLLSTDRQQAVQITPRSFSFHRLRPYIRWESFARPARDAWGTFAAVFHPERITEVQLRYLNVFQLPMPFEDWGDFLVIHPDLPPPVDTGLTNYLMSLALADANVPATANVTQATEPEKNGLVPVVLDIDTRTPVVLGGAPGGEHEEQLWRTLDRLREYKNRLFFEGLTERAKELFR